ncbi:hypothetical protein [Methylobacterium dankookense]|uniref:Uncharacterized protein n=1 Tax=Methylobacterium dankookense TaxID=560405 RepID=A0A564G3Y6_9HYPH|nr:hypothetical protein [Methylobacterium dankookense]GJD57279.1 hypothetical protein IFDJLNFL_3180 [Methylobacterium dankookense]VUF14690.1 hypothetical protein MTDSW087_04415 [Methylobacterium dankookense]
MTIHMPGIPENVVLAQSVNGRLRADASLIAARAFLMRAAGAGLFAALLGAGIGAAAFGWAYLNQYETAAERIAQAMQSALSEVTLKTKGEVTLTDNVLRLDQPVAQAKPDFASVVASQKDDGNAAVRTTFTVFKSVPHLDGNIVTGWQFKGDERQPESQYCYFSHPQKFGSDVLTQVNIAINGQVAPQTSSELDLKRLSKSCVWFDPKKV